MLFFLRIPDIFGIRFLLDISYTICWYTFSSKLIWLLKTMGLLVWPCFETPFSQMVQN